MLEVGLRVSAVADGYLAKDSTKTLLMAKMPELG